MKKITWIKQDRKFFLMIFYLLCILGLYIRNCFGIDMEDEPYCVSSVFQVLQGNVPLMSIWDGHTGFFLLCPLGALYQMLVPSLDGVVLFFREAGLTVSLVFAAVNIKLIANKYHDKSAWILLLPVCILTPVLKLTYNSASALLLGTVCVLMYTSQKEKKESLRYFAAGVMSGLACLNYPTFAFIAVFLFFYVMIRNRNNYCLQKTVFYSAGVGIIGMAFFAWIFSAGSMEEFLPALKGILNAPHTEYRGPVNASFFYQTFLVGAGRFFKRKYTGILLLYMAALWMINKRVHESAREACLAGAYMLFCLVSILPNRTGYGYSIFGIAIGFMAVMFLLDKHFIKKHLIFYEIVLLYVLIYSFTSDNKNVMLGISACSPIIGLTILLTLYERTLGIKVEGTAGNTAGSKRKAYLVLAAVLSAVGMAHTYGRIYGDGGNIFKLSARMESGVFKGQWTTPEKKEYLDNMESFLDENISSLPGIESKDFAVITLEPMAYLMTDARMYTPWTFDSEYLFKGFFSSKPVTDYYEAYGRYPQVLFATNYHNEDFFENPEYEINGLIEEKYSLLASEKLSEDVTAWVWLLDGQ